MVWSNTSPTPGPVVVFLGLFWCLFRVKTDYLGLFILVNWMILEIPEAAFAGKTIRVLPRSLISLHGNGQDFGTTIEP